MELRAFLEMVVVATTVTQMPLQFWQTRARPKRAAQAWNAKPRTYCETSSKYTVGLMDDEYGFGLTKYQCQERCESSPACQHFAHGHWEKGGRIRCQLFSRCDEKPSSLMSVSDKPYEAPEDPSRIRKPKPEFPSLAACALLMVLNVLIVQPALLLGNWGVLPCAIIASVVSAWVIHDGGSKTIAMYGRGYIGLVLCHVVNSVGLIGLALVGVDPLPKEIRDELMRGGPLPAELRRLLPERDRGEFANDVLAVAKEYEVSLAKTEGASLAVGAQAIGPLLLIETIRPGLVEAWNAEHPDRIVTVGDSIVEANGVRDDTEKMFQECQKSGLLKLKLLRGGGSREDAQRPNSKDADSTKSRSSGASSSTREAPSSTMPEVSDAKVSTDSVVHKRKA